ncbi:autotransporter outer membrane beta-barrel domain-containing protein [Pantoea sp. M_9]|uniref:autotransporter outer membrane beta-barrel domain-containing protein n=1 Tax=Pantoea sp. M_9 TaxID=2608041 RepID=UPI00168119BC|nr:autotransporter outer membrane beta-barrel domain-containing protein [Pantoea sp. M_9]
MSGPGASRTVAPGEAAEEWLVENAATLILLSGSQVVSTPYGSDFLPGVTAKSESLVEATGTEITAVGRGLLLMDATLTMTGSQVTAADSGMTGRTADYVSGVAMNMFSGEAAISQSVLQGERHAIAVSGDIGLNTDTATIDVASSQLVSDKGSAILVGNYRETGQPGMAPPPVADIVLRDGTTVRAGNGHLLEVRDNATAHLTVSHSDITGNILSGPDATTDVSLMNDAMLRGSMQGVDTVTIADSATWQVTGDSVVDSLTNAGTVAFSDDTVGRTLTVTGNYTGNDGLMVFNGRLNGDDSLVDKLVIQGDTAGNTHVRVNNLGGRGVKTLNGIELITVGGRSAGEFTQAGRIVAGAYDYHLARGKGANAGNWYLSSERSDGTTPPPDGGTTPPPDGGTTPPADGKNPDSLVLRPEGGAYAANLAAAQRLFDVRLADRQAGTDYTDAATGERRYTSLWMKNTGMHNRADDTSGQLHTRSNSYALMLGGDVATGITPDGGSWRAGLMAGYGHNRSTTHSDLTGYGAKGTVTGYTTGVYGTWYQQGPDQEGLYVDTLLQYSWFDNRVSGDDVAAEKYKSGGLQVSAEAGWVAQVAPGWFVQPNARLGWSGVKADTHTEASGTRVKQRDGHNVHTRAGVRGFATFANTTIKPFAEVNWVHNTQHAAVTMDDVTVGQAGSRNVAEVAAGVQGSITPALKVTAGVIQQTGTHSYSNTAGTLGVRWTF